MCYILTFEKEFLISELGNHLFFSLVFGFSRDY